MVVRGDYDGDGDLDLMSGNDYGSNLLYRNEKGVLTNSGWTDPFSDATRSVAWGDYDGDGDLDVAAGNFEDPNRVYRNDDGVLVDSGWTDPYTDTAATTEALWGDMDGDGDLDLVAGNYQASRMYWNEDGVLTTSGWTDTLERSTDGIALGDYDGDGDLDLATGSVLASNDLYRNNRGILSDSGWSDPFTETVYSGAWGDYDSDGDLDLVVGGSGITRLYRNDAGNLVNAGWSYTGTAESLAWGDYDGDGDLDLAAGYEVARIFRNDEGHLAPVWVSSEANPKCQVAWGDYDGDGDLDLAAGNYAADDAGSDTYYSPNHIYRNDDGTWTLAWSAREERDQTNSVDWGDYDNDGDIDLAVSNDAGPNRVYENRQGTFELAWSSEDQDFTETARWGDVNQDGYLDLIAGNWIMASNRLYHNENGQLADSGWLDPLGTDTVHMAWGDVDSDGDLDLAAANLGRNSLYTNLDGILVDSSWSDPVTDFSWFVAWADYDRDGDLDLASGNDDFFSASLNRLYRNNLISSPALPNQPAYVLVETPGNTADAFFRHTSEIIRSPCITVSYRLFDPEGDTVRRIEPYFSLNGGGHWLPATPADDTITTDLTTSPDGVRHKFIWDAQADLVKNDNVVFRIVAHANPDHAGFALHPPLSGQTFPFRVQTTEWYAKVVDGAGDPIPGSTVYRAGQPVTNGAGNPVMSDQAGLVSLSSSASGTSLAALSPVLYEHPTARAGHDGWAYRVHLTSLDLDDDGTAQPHLVTQPGEQRLTLRKDNPLILLNLVASIEWDATLTYTQQISRAFRRTSDYLHDLTDGQMAFGHVAIYDDGAYWANADVQISTKNIVRPHAYVGGIAAEDKSHVIRIGRYWDGDSGAQGAWDQPEGYRTLAHEFGHYALHLYDEYFAYVFDEHGNLTDEVKAYCTAPRGLLPQDDATSASAMYYHYNTSELSARDTPGLWSALCEQTAQWQINGESCWETLVRTYTDPLTPPRWQLTTPAERGGVMTGPVGLSSALPDLPRIELHQQGASAPPKHLTVHGPDGPYQGAIVALYKQSGRVIGQGVTDGGGQLEIYGAAAGDTVRAAAFDGGLHGSATVGAAREIDLALEPVSGLTAQAEDSAPSVRLIAEPSPDPDQIDLRIWLHGFGDGIAPVVSLTAPGDEASYSPQMTYVSDTGVYTGSVSFGAAQGMGRLQATGAMAGQLVRLQSDYRLQRVSRDQSQDIYANDGNLSLHLEPGSIPGNNAYLVIAPPGAAPGPLPEGMTIVGNAYDVTLSGALMVLEQPIILKLHYDDAMLKASAAPKQPGIYRWHPISETWQMMPSRLDKQQQTLATPATALGTYALLTPSAPSTSIFLPVVLRRSIH
jgi:hypothetical protein